MAQLIENISARHSKACKIYADGTVIISPNRKQYTQFKPNQNETKDKKFSMSASVKRSIRSKGIAIFHDAQANGNVAVFYTLTTAESNKLESNEVISKYLENCRKNLGVLQYVWVRERQKNGSNHWHIIAECKPITHERPLNYTSHKRAWNAALSSSGYKPSPNSVRFGKKPILKNYFGVIAYVTKYCTKGTLKDEVIRVTQSSRIKYKGLAYAEHCIQKNPKRVIWAQWACVYKFEADCNYRATMFKYIESYNIINQIFLNYEIRSSRGEWFGDVSARARPTNVGRIIRRNGNSYEYHSNNGRRWGNHESIGGCI